MVRYAATLGIALILGSGAWGVAFASSEAVLLDDFQVQDLGSNFLDSAEAGPNGGIFMVGRAGKMQQENAVFVRTGTLDGGSYVWETPLVDSVPDELTGGASVTAISSDLQFIGTSTIHVLGTFSWEDEAGNEILASFVWISEDLGKSWTRAARPLSFALHSFGVLLKGKRYTTSCSNCDLSFRDPGDREWVVLESPDGLTWTEMNGSRYSYSGANLSSTPAIAVDPNGLLYIAGTMQTLTETDQGEIERRLVRIVRQYSLVTNQWKTTNQQEVSVVVGDNIAVDSQGDLILEGSFLEHNSAGQFVRDRRIFESKDAGKNWSLVDRELIRESVGDARSRVGARMIFSSNADGFWGFDTKDLGWQLKRKSANPSSWTELFQFRYPNKSRYPSLGADPESSSLMTVARDMISMPDRSWILFGEVVNTANLRSRIIVLRLK